MPTVKFRLRRDTSANWTSINPILALGEPARETNTRLGKTGDGVTAWASLGYDLSPITLTGDVTGTGIGGASTVIAPNAVTFGKLVAATQKALIGANAAGNYQEITLGSGVSLAAGVLSATGTGGSVTSVSVVTANGISGSVATPTTTPAITLTLGAITPTSVAASGTVTGLNLSGTNTGDQTTITGNAGTATKLLTGRTLSITGDLVWSSGSFDGSANVTAAGTLATVNANVGSFGSATQTATFTVNAKGLTTAASNVTITPAVGSITGLGTGVSTALAANIGTAGAFVTFNGALGTPSSGTLTNCTFPTLNQNTTGNAGTATALQTARNINGTSFNGTANITIPIADALISDPAAIALFARMSVAPADARKFLIANTILALKQAGIWAKIDCLYLTAAHDAQAGRLNWKAAANDLAAVGTLPTFTTDRGYQGNGSSELLTTGFIPGTGKALQDDHHMAVWSRTSGQFATAEMGADSLSITSRSTSDLFTTRSANTTGVSTANLDGSGFFLLSRTGSAGYAQYRNGALFASPVQASAAFGGVYAAYVCGRNNSGTPNYNTRQLSAATIGGGLTVTEQAAAYNILLTYLQAVGAA